MKFFISSVLVLTCTFSGMSQDKIFKKGGAVLTVKVQEIGVDEIKYKVYGEENAPVYAIEKDRIVKIVFENGRTETYRHSLSDPELYIGQSKHAIKFSFLSPLTGYSQFSYERNIRPGRSWEASLGIIGLGKNQVIEYYYYDPTNGYTKDFKRDQAGVVLGFGYKFIRTPDFINRNIRYAHLLQGTYLKPNLYTGVYSENMVDNKTGTPTVNKQNVVFGTLMLELGKQWVFSEQFLLDIYGGLGYCFDNIPKDASSGDFGTNSEYLGHHFTHIRLGQSPGVALNLGLRVGMVLGKKQQ